MISCFCIPNAKQSPRLGKASSTQGLPESPPEESASYPAARERHSKTVDLHAAPAVRAALPRPPLGVDPTDRTTGGEPRPQRHHGGGGGGGEGCIPALRAVLLRQRGSTKGHAGCASRPPPLPSPQPPQAPQPSAAADDASGPSVSPPLLATNTTASTRAAATTPSLEATAPPPPAPQSAGPRLVVPAAAAAAADRLVAEAKAEGDVEGHVAERGGGDEAGCPHGVPLGQLADRESARHSAHPARQSLARGAARESGQAGSPSALGIGGWPGLAAFSLGSNRASDPARGGRAPDAEAPRPRPSGEDDAEAATEGTDGAGRGAFGGRRVCNSGAVSDVSKVAVVGDDDDGDNDGDGYVICLEDVATPSRIGGLSLEGGGASSPLPSPSLHSSASVASSSASFPNPPVSPQPASDQANPGLGQDLDRDAPLFEATYAPSPPARPDLAAAAPVHRLGAGRRTAFRQAARALQLQTSLQRSQAVAAAAAAVQAAAETALDATSTGQGYEFETGSRPEEAQWREGAEERGPPAEARQGEGEWRSHRRASGVAVRTGGSLRIMHLTARTAPRSPLTGTLTGTVAAAGHGPQSNRLYRQHTPLMLRRLRITASRSASGSFGHLDFLDACTPVTAGTPPPRPRDASASAAASGSSKLRLRVVQVMLPFDAPVGPRERGGGGGGGAAAPPGRHARFASGAVDSPRTKAPALLARQQTPCPLRWLVDVSPTGCWEDSGDALTEAAGRCWAAVAPAMDTVEEAGGAEARRRRLGRVAVDDDDDDGEDDGGGGGGGEREQDAEAGADLVEAVDWMLEAAMSGGRVLSRGDSLNRTCQVTQSRFGSPAPEARRLSTQGQGLGPVHAHAQPPPHLRSLRVQLSVAKLRRPSISSVLSLVGGDGGELTTQESISVALRTPYGSGRYGGGVGVTTPTRRGRRRNLAGNETLAWDFATPIRLSNFGPAADPTVPGGPPPSAAAAADGDERDADDYVRGPAAAAGGRPPGPHGGSHAPVALAAPLPRQPPQYGREPSPLRIRELAAALGRSQGLLAAQQQHEQLSAQGSPSPSKPSQLAAPPLDAADPVRAVWSRASSACSGTAFCTTDAWPPSQGHLVPLRHAPRLVAERTADEGGEYDYGSLADSFVMSPTARLGSGVSRLAFQKQLLAVANAADADADAAPAGGGRATHSSDGRAGGLLPTRRGPTAAAAAAAAAVGAARAASVSDMAALVPPGGAAGAASAGRAAPPRRRALYHTGSVRSHAPTEDDSAESLAKCSEKEVPYSGVYGQGLGTPLEYGAPGLFTEEVNIINGTVSDWGAGLAAAPWGRPEADGGLDGAHMAVAREAQKGGGPAVAGSATELPRGVVGSGRQRAVAVTVAEAGAFWAAAAATTGGGDSPKAAGAAAAAAGAWSPLGHVAGNEYPKGLAAMGAGVSSRLSRCT